MANNDLQRQMDEARANGYSEEQIQEYLNPQPVKETTIQPQNTGPMSTTTVQTPSTPWVDRGPEETALTQSAGIQAAKYAAEGAAGYVAAKKLLPMIGQAFGKTPVAPVAPAASGIQVPLNVGGGPRPTTPPGNPQQMWNALKTPPGAPTPSAPPPAGGPAAEQGSTFLQRLGQQFGQMRQAVAPVIEQAATRVAPYARGAGGVAAAVMPGNVGQNYGAQFPQAGPMRGMEINPQTGAPWTPQELAQYAQLNQ